MLDPNGNCGPSAGTWTKGITYWVCGSDTEYRWTCTRNTTGTGTLTIKKATASSHGTDTGWQSAYGTKQAIWNGIRINTTNVTIDGQTGSGTSGHGFKFISTPTAEINKLVDLPAGEEHSSFTLQYAEMTSRTVPIQNGCIDAGTCMSEAIGLRRTDAKAGQTYSFTNLYIHDVAGPIQMESGTTNPLSTITMDGLYIVRNDDTEAHHSACITFGALSDTVTMKNSWLQDCWGTAVITCTTGGTYTAHSNWNFYNNVFLWSTGFAYSNPSGIKLLGSTGAHSNLNFYSNTFVNRATAPAGNIFANLEIVAGATWTGVNVKNNLFYSAPATGFYAQHSTTSGITVDDNSYYQTTHNDENGHVAGSASPFTNHLS